MTTGVAIRIPCSAVDVDAPPRARARTASDGHPTRVRHAHAAAHTHGDLRFGHRDRRTARAALG
eukprot:7126529-Prymnesium_polylepis.1